MKASAVTLTLILAATLLAGCGGKSATPDGPSLPPVDANKGAITGIVIDDRYRPVPDAQLLLTPLGLTATSDSEGQFSFGSLDPGPYLILASAKDHEAAPKNIDVQAGQYSEIEVQARRTFSEGAYTISTEYSVFIPCAVDFIANGVVADCTGDQSGDSYRPGFYSDYTPHRNNVTYLVAEMLANQKDRYEIQIRCENSGVYYAVQRIKDTTYGRLTLHYGNVTPDSPVPPEYGATGKWDNKCKTMHTILFSDSTGREELQSAGLPVCCGVGAHAGIKAKFIQTLFLGPQWQASDVMKFAVLKPGG